MLYIDASGDIIYVSIGIPLSKRSTSPVIFPGKTYTIIEITADGSKTVGTFQCKGTNKVTECGPITVRSKNGMDIYEYRGHYYAELSSGEQIYADKAANIGREKKNFTEFDGNIVNYEGRRYVNMIATSIIKTKFTKNGLETSINGNHIITLPLSKEKTKVIEKHLISDDILYMKLRINGETVELYVYLDYDEVEVKTKHGTHTGDKNMTDAILKIIENSASDFVEAFI